MLILALTAATQGGNPRKHTPAMESEEATNEHPANGGPKVQKESPIACNMDALTPSERKRLEELIPMLLQLHSGVRELRDGYEFQFPRERKSFSLLTEWAELENRCCPFFEITIRLGKEGGPYVFQLTGREGTKEFVRDAFAGWFNM